MFFQYLEEWDDEQPDDVEVSVWTCRELRELQNYLVEALVAFPQQKSKDDDTIKLLFNVMAQNVLLTLGAPGIGGLGPAIPGTRVRRGGTCGVGPTPPTYAPA